MKHYITLIAIITILSCKAQTIIVPMENGQYYKIDPNYYLKDTNNEFNKYIGTWKYQNGDTSLTFKLKKEEHYQAYNESNYQDLLAGEYQYIENGVEKANTLPDFNNASVSGYDHKISGGIFIHRLPIYCTDNSNIAEIKIELFIKHPFDRFIEGRLILRYVNTNGIEKLEICIYDYTTLADDENARIDIPDGYYELIKQN